MEPAGSAGVKALISVRSLRIKFPASELEQLREAVSQFNDFSDYISDIQIKEFKEHQALQIPAAEAALFAQSYIDELPKFTKRRLRKDMIEATEEFLDGDPGNLPVAKSLEILKSLVF